MRHLRQDYVHIDIAFSVGQAVKVLRDKPPIRAINYVYVVNDARVLLGVVPTRRLLFSPESTPISELVVREIRALSSADTMKNACDLFTKHRLLALPVVDVGGHFLGIVDLQLFAKEIDDLVTSTQRDDLFQLVGIRGSEAGSPFPLTAFRQRFPWLGCNLLGGVIAAFLTGHYQQTLNRYVALAFFFPVVLNLGESVSAQSLSLALEFLRNESIPPRALLKKLQLEAITGGLLGLGCGLVIASVALVWLREWRVAICLIGGILGGVMIAAIMGFAVPAVLRLLGKQPHIAAGPIALAGSDIFSLLFYLSLAHWMLPA